MTNTPCRLAVLLSGAGSTMLNLQKEIDKGEVPAQIAVVISSRKRALGVERARSLGIHTHVLARKPFIKEGWFDSVAYSKSLVDILRDYNVELVVMAGFMTRLEKPILERYNVINVHPALLPMFGGENYYGHHVHEAVLAAGVKVSGATVHFADAVYDHGPIILQKAIDVLEDDTADSLAGRVQAVEREIYPQAVKLYAQRRIKREGGRVRILPE